MPHAVLFVITSECNQQIILEVRFMDKMGNYETGKTDEAVHDKHPQVCETTPRHAHRGTLPPVCVLKCGTQNGHLLLIVKVYSAYEFI